MNNRETPNTRYVTRPAAAMRPMISFGAPRIFSQPQSTRIVASNWSGLVRQGRSRG